MNRNINFHIQVMPPSRPSDYCLGCLDDSVFIDFEKSDNLIKLVRISFDGFGCCVLSKDCKALSLELSKEFESIISTGIQNQTRLFEIVAKILLENKEYLWEDALIEYGLIDV